MQHPRRAREGSERGPAFHQRPNTFTPQRYHQQRDSTHGSPRHTRPASRGQENESVPAGREIKLVSNAYNISTATRNITIHEYELNVQPSSSCRDLPSKVLARAYVSRSIRQLMMRDIIPELSGPNVPRGSIIIEPNLEIIFTLCPLALTSRCSVPGSSSPNQNEFRITNLQVDTDLISPLQIDLTIKFSRLSVINPANYSFCLLGSIIHHELSMRMMRYGSVYYTIADLSRRSQERLDLISCHLPGITISGVRKSSGNQTLVVVNSTNSYLTQSHRIIDLLATFVADRPVENVTLYHQFYGSYDALYRLLIPELAMVQPTEDSFKNFESILTGYKCHSIDYRGIEVNFRFSLTKEPASHLYVNDHMTVVDFYRSLGVTLNYPNLPCLKTKSANHPYYPMETCSLLAGQKVPIFRLSSSARSHLILMNKPHPNKSKRTSLLGRNEIASISRDQFNAFGINISQEPAEASGCTLNKPLLEYKNEILNPNRDYWESGSFYQTIDLDDNWCLVDTVGVQTNALMNFMSEFSNYSSRFGLRISAPHRIYKSKQDIMEQPDSMDHLIYECSKSTRRELRFVMFIIDSMSTQLNRLIHLSFDEHPTVSASCLRQESIMNQRQHRSIFRTLVHKINARLGGTNHIYNHETWDKLALNARDIMVIGLDVTHPDNELNGVSIVGCAYTYSNDLFRHKSLVWPQTARKEIIAKMDALVERLLTEYRCENDKLPEHIIVYRDGVSNEEFERVRAYEITKAAAVIDKFSKTTKQDKPRLSYIIAQKRHTMRFFQVSSGNNVQNPPSGTLINQGIMPGENREFFLYSNTSPQATARPLHYHVLEKGMELDNLQKLTYYLCFNFGKCSSSLSMPSSLRYAHNAAYDARNRVIANREFSENKFYTTKFFC